MASKSILVLLLFGPTIILSACNRAPSPAVLPSPTSATAPSSVPATTISTAPPTVPASKVPATQTATAVHPFSPAQGSALASAGNDWFATAGKCVICHQNNVDEAGNDVSNGEYWRSTMMANAATDPYYLASVSIEVERFPGFRAVIEDKCNTCHMPMAHFSDAAQGKQGLIFGDDGYLNTQHPLHTLAVDGVSCTTCHQIQDNGLGNFASFSGGMVFDLQTPPGQRAIFGPFPPRQSGKNIMSGVSGFTPQESDHLAKSELCATCHNLYTNYVTEEGTLSEDYFPEQTPYTEWLNSDYVGQSTCQDCHMPLAEGAVALTNAGPTIMRSPYAKHSFVGGNVYVLKLLKNFGGELGVQANTDHFDATIARTMTQLQTKTATLTVSEPAFVDGMLSFDVSVNALTGHKFPTSYPSRRAWLHATVKDANGRVIFESGRAGHDGAISGNDNDADPLAFEPHYDEIVSPDQVQIYEAIMRDAKGEVTTELLLAASYAKDNRLLPAGFDRTAASDDIAPYGDVVADDDFAAGTDTVSYRVDTEGATGPFTVDVELLYQSIGYRWAQNVAPFDTEQARLFRAYYNTVPNVPIAVAAQSAKSR